MNTQEQTAADLDKEMMKVLTGDKSVEESLNLETVTEPETTTVPPTQEGTVEPEKPEGEPDKTDDLQGDDKATDPVVMTKDGEHTLPFSVVEGLREQVADLSSKLLEATRTGDTAELAATPEFSQADLDLVKEEMPELAEAMEKLVEERKGLVEKVNSLESKVVDNEKETAQTAAAEAQATIDSIPKLAHIQANAPELFDKAVDVDKELTGRTEYDSLPQAERFAKALSVVEAMYGEVIVPGNSSTESPEVIVKEAAKEVKSLPVDATPPIPNSLSDLPAGSPPIHDPLAAITDKSPIDIINNFTGKTPVQIEDMVNNLI